MTHGSVRRAEKWRSVVPDLPHAPAELAHAVTRLYRHRVSDAVDAYVTSQVAGAHPDAGELRAEERAARDQHEAVEQARRQLEQAVYDELKPFGRLGYTRHPEAALAQCVDELATVIDEFGRLERHIDKLHREQAIRALPTGALDAERQTWQTHRTQQQAAARHEAQKRRQRGQQPHRRELAPTYTSPDRGPGIGR